MAWPGHGAGVLLGGQLSLAVTPDCTSGSVRAARGPLTGHHGASSPGLLPPRHHLPLHIHIAYTSIWAPGCDLGQAAEFGFSSQYRRTPRHCTQILKTARWVPNTNHPKMPVSGCLFHLPQEQSGPVMLPWGGTSVAGKAGLPGVQLPPSTLEGPGPAWPQAQAGASQLARIIVL